MKTLFILLILATVPALTYAAVPSATTPVNCAGAGGNCQMMAFTPGQAHYNCTPVAASSATSRPGLHDGKH